MSFTEAELKALRAENAAAATSTYDVMLPHEVLQHLRAPGRPVPTPPKAKLTDDERRKIKKFEKQQARKLIAAAQRVSTLSLDD